MQEPRAFTPAMPPVSGPRLTGRFKPSTSALVSVAGNIANSSGGGSGFIGTAAKIAEAYSNLPPEVKAAAKQAVTNRFTNTSKGNQNMDGSSSYALTRLPNPKETTLKTGVRPNTYTSDFITAEENICSPLHLSGGRLSFPTTVTHPLWTYVRENIAFQIQARAQSSVSFNLNISTKFTAENIITAISAAMYALQVFYYYRSIIAYSSNPMNQNEGMRSMRTAITPQAIQDLELLGDRLMLIPVPPNLLELVRYMNTTYTSGTTPESALIKFCPHTVTATGVDVSQIAVAYNALSSDILDEVFGLMRKAIPTWIVKTLYDVPVDPVHDTNFLTIWANSPSTAWNTTLSTVDKFPIVASTDATIAYNSFTKDLDGTAFALTGMYSGTDWFPTLLSPYFTGTASVNTANSRRSWYKVGASKAFYIVQDYPFVIRSRQETYYYDKVPGLAVSSHLFGTNRCRNVNTESVTESVYNALDVVFDVQSLPIGQASRFGRESMPSSGKSNKRKSYKK